MWKGTSVEPEPVTSEYLMDYVDLDDQDERGPEYEQWIPKPLPSERLSTTQYESSDSDDESSTATAIIPLRVPKSTKESKPKEPRRAMCVRYQGVTTADDMEAKLDKTDFFLYHELPEVTPVTLDDLKLGLPLKVAYRTSLGEYRHYPIKEQVVQNKTAAINYRLYSVKCGNDKVPAFPSVNKLVNHYEKYGCLQTRPYKQSPTVDVFPWWLDEETDE